MLTFISAFVASCLCALWRRSVRKSKTVEGILRELQAELQHERDKRQADRQGRIRAEKALNEMMMMKGGLLPDGEPSRGNPLPGPVAGALGIKYPFAPIGVIHSPFVTRNGTPRQPLLVGTARSVLQLSPHVPPETLEGLAGYSHCWVLYVFHMNTDIGKHLRDEVVPPKAKIRVPRLDGGRMGVLATRSPHRPSPIGLSLGKVMKVEGSQVVLGGLDVVHGSPVLDIKPYVPFCDCVPEALAPSWVAPTVLEGEEPLHIQEVRMSAGCEASIRTHWAEGRGLELYPDVEDFLQFVVEVLSRDIRSVYQRRKAQQQGGNSMGGGSGHEDGAFHVRLGGLDLLYHVDRDNLVHVVGARGVVDAHLQAMGETPG